jgi:hypothetical protein
MKGFHLFSNWLDGDLGTKARSVIGTAKRIVMRGYHKPYRYGDFSL